MSKIVDTLFDGILVYDDSNHIQKEEVVEETKSKTDYKKYTSKFFFPKKKEEEINEDDDTPRYKCDTMSTMSVSGFIDLLEDNGYKSGVKKWNVFIPNGYNDIDEKLKKVKISNDEQFIFAIPGCDNLVSKYNVWKSLVDKYGRETASTIVPESFLLDNKEDVELLKKFDNQKFILKKKKQRKLGLKLVDKIEDISKLKKEEYTIAQKYLKPFLVNDRKVNLRIYLLITLKNNEITIYVSKFGSCIYTKHEYDHSSCDFEKNITSYNMDLSIYEENPLTLEQLKTYLKNNGFDHIDIFSKIENKIKLFICAIKDQLGDEKFNKNMCFQVFGMDFILDENLDPFLLECNKGPEMKPKVTQIEDPDDITEDMINQINILKETLNNGDDGIDKIKKIKSCYIKIYKGFPKNVSRTVIMERIEKFYKEEKELDSYPNGYITGNGIKVQKDTLHIMNLIENNENNGFIKVDVK